MQEGTAWQDHYEVRTKSSDRYKSSNNDTAPNKGGDPTLYIGRAAGTGASVVCPHACTNVVKHGKAISSLEYTVQKPKTDLRKAKVKRGTN